MEAFHVKGLHEERWEELNAYAQINVLTDKQADKIY
jgi:hypothetical protein